MHYLLRTLLILLTMAWPQMGCGRGSTPTGPSDAAAYSFEVRSESGTTQKSFSGNFEVTIGHAHVRVLEGALTVDGKPHGDIKPGDAVMIEADGQVLVNLKVREPL